jgi:8-oxo-dGTP diphosphatase
MPISDYMRDLRAHVGNAMIMVPSVSAVVVNDAGEILLGQRSDNGQWSLLAGMMDPGEQPADAIVREVYEESAVEVRVERILGVATHGSTYPNGNQCQFTNIWFLCTPIGGEARVNDEESLAVGWFAPDALPPVADYVRLRIDTYLKGETAAWFAPPGESHPAIKFT